MTLKNLGALYKRQGKLQAASALDDIASQQQPHQAVCQLGLFVPVLCSISLLLMAIECF